MKSIWKYPVNAGGHVVTHVQMREGAEILCVENQRQLPMIWALVDPDAPIEVRKIVSYGTGRDIDREGLKYIGTIMMEDEIYVFHFFEILETK